MDIADVVVEFSARNPGTRVGLREDQRGVVLGVSGSLELFGLASFFPMRESDG
jgi:hypothetical protein